MINRYAFGKMSHPKSTYHTSRSGAASILVKFSFSEITNLCPIFVPIFVTKSHSHLIDIKILYKIEIKSIEIVTNKATLIRASRQSRQAICMVPTQYFFL